MSRNLVELIRRHHGVHPPTALDVLKAAVDDHGELTDEDRKHAAEVSGLPEATVYGISSFDDDLLAPRGAVTCACARARRAGPATGGAHVDAVKKGLSLDLGEKSADGDDPVFDNPTGKGQFAVPPYKAPGDAADNEFPPILVTGRVLQHYNAGTMTRRTYNVDLVDRDWLEVHPVDAARLWISDREKVAVRSRVGQTELYAKVTDRIEPGHVFTSFHFPEARTNLLIGQAADVNTSCPEYNVVAVDVRPMAEQPAFTPALTAAD